MQILQQLLTEKLDCSDLAFHGIKQYFDSTLMSFQNSKRIKCANKNCIPVLNSLALKELELSVQDMRFKQKNMKDLLVNKAWVSFA